jgi:DtxR family Mn-dependent transcriptional regulator
MEALGFSWDEVHEQADILEHVISERLEERIAAALNYPEFDPHGDPIPSKEGVVTAVNTCPLSALAKGERARVARILDDSNSELLRYLAELGLVPDVILTVTDIAPFEGPLTIQINGRIRAIGYNLAAAILVELVDSRLAGSE